MKTTIKTQSSATFMLSYDDRTQMLTVKMQYAPPKSHAETLVYSGVPKHVFQAFQDAPSKGGFFNKNIRNNYTLVSN